MEDKETLNSIQKDLLVDKIKVVCTGVLAVVLMFIELYIMMNYQFQFVGMGVIAVLLIADIYFLISGILDIKMLTTEVQRRDYQEIYNAQKASYLVIRKSFEELAERLTALEENGAIPADEIINAQKAVAKVTISRNKENTDALMNSNDELINRFFAFEESLSASNDQMNRISQEFASGNSGIMSQMDAITRQIQAMEVKLASQQAAPAPAPQPVYVPFPAMQMPQYAMPGMQGMPDMSQMAPQPMPQMAPPVMPDMTAPVMPDMPDLEETPVFEGTPFEETPVIPEEPLVEETPIFEETPVMEETLPELEPELIAEPEFVPEPEPISEPEPVVEEAPAPAFVPSDDPNAKMSDDDIAALIASMSGGAAPAAEPEPVPEPEPVVEETPAPAFVPSDDPNAKMSDDDIAALIASMNGSAPAVPEPEPEPAPEPAPIDFSNSGVDLSDPNHNLTPDEIAKLFASV